MNRSNLFVTTIAVITLGIGAAHAESSNPLKPAPTGSTAGTGMTTTAPATGAMTSPTAKGTGSDHMTSAPSKGTGAMTAPSTGAATPASGAMDKAKPAKAPASAELQALRKDCSAQADAKNLHGKERQTFRNQCIKDGSKKS